MLNEVSPLLDAHVVSRILRARLDAAALVALRKQRGGFKSLDELKEVRGIGDAGLAKLRPYARLSGKTTAAAR